MGSLPALHDSLLGYTAIFICIGFSLLFLQKAASSEVGPGYWSASFFLNDMGGGLIWAGSVTSKPFLFFFLGEKFHMLGFFTLVFGTPIGLPKIPFSAGIFMLLADLSLFGWE